MIRFPSRAPRGARHVVAAAQALESRTLLSSTLAYDFTPGDQGSGPHDFVTLGGDAYFFTETAINAGPGKSLLWKSDGTDAGTSIVKEFAVPNPGVGGSHSGRLSVVGDRLFFFASETPGPPRPWVSDGTPGGTRVVSTEVSGQSSIGSSEIVGTGDLAVFNTDRTWVTDGTPEGTRALAELPQGGTQSREFGVSGGRVFISALTAAGGIGLYTADGTVGGTRLLHDFGNDGTTFLPRVFQMTDVNGTLFFVAPAAPGSGGELWKSDGTPEGTLLVKDIVPGTDSSRPGMLTNIGGTLFFGVTEDPAANPPGGSVEALWKSDGTEAGTVRVLDRAPGSTIPLSPNNITAWQGVALFAGSDSERGTELWRSDGTPGGTYLLYDTVSGTEKGLSGSPEFRPAADQLFFRVLTAASRFELWVTDGTAQGTRPAAEADPAGPQHLGGGAAAGDKLVYRGSASADAPGVWVSDGTPGGTRPIGGIMPTPLSTRFEPFIPFGPDRILVNRFGGSVSVVDAANNAVTLIGGVTLASEPYARTYAQPGWAMLGDDLIFAARPSSNINSMRLYRTDGTPEGTSLISSTVDLDPDAWEAHGTAPTLVPFNGHVYFAGGSGTLGMELWRTDGTAAGTTMVRDLNVGFNRHSMLAGNKPTMAVLGNRLYFGALGDQLWKTDGTSAGTELVLDINGVAGFGHFTRVGDRLLFRGLAGGRSNMLWTSDGTTAGTAPFARPVSVFSRMVVRDGVAYFVGGEVGGVTSALFRSDGTPDGTYPLLGPGLAPQPTEFVAAGDAVYLVSEGALWRSDGTVAGTAMLINPGTQANLNSLAAVGDTLYFSMSDAAHGQELWKTDGTPAGTVLAEDVWPGAFGSNPSFLTAVGDTLYFAAADMEHGTELRRLDAGGAPAATVAAAHVFYNHSALDGNDASANAGDDAAVAPDKSALGAGQAPTFTHITSYSRGINGVMLDVSRLPAGATWAASDFTFRAAGGGAGATWGPGPQPASVTIRRGAGVNGSDRVTLVWNDYDPASAAADQAVANGWLEVTVKSTPNTGLVAPAVFRFGNLIGNTGDGAVVDANDIAATRAAQRRPAGVSSAFDFNRDGQVNVLDLFLARRSAGNALTAPPADSVVVVAATVPRRATRRDAYALPR
jgi:ELWxxDGT repeat protein